MSGIRRRARGELEGAVLQVLRARAEPIGAGEIQTAICGDQPAYTTVLTALDRLCEKGEVVRYEDSPRKVRFSASYTAAESASASMMRTLAQNEDRRAALLKFAGDLTEDDAAFLRTALSAGRDA